MSEIDSQIASLADAAPADSTTPAPADSTTPAPADGTTPAPADAAAPSKTPMIIGGVLGTVALVGLGVFVYKKRQNSEDKEGGSADDLFTKLVTEA